MTNTTLESIFMWDWRCPRNSSWTMPPPPVTEDGPQQRKQHQDREKQQHPPSAVGSKLEAMRHIEVHARAEGQCRIVRVDLTRDGIWSCHREAIGIELAEDRSQDAHEANCGKTDVEVSQCPRRPLHLGPLPRTWLHAHFDGDSRDAPVTVWYRHRMTSTCGVRSRMVRRTQRSTRRKGRTDLSVADSAHAAVRTSRRYPTPRTRLPAVAESRLGRGFSVIAAAVRVRRCR